MSTAEIDESILANEYHALPGVSNSKLKDFIDDPRIYWWKHLSGRYRQPQGDHFDFGSAVHEIALLGSNSNIVVIPEDVLSASGSRAGGKWKEFAAANDDKILLKQADYNAVIRCVDSIYAHPVANELLKAQGVAERGFAAEFQELGFALRCRPDRLVNLNGKTIVVDLKTTSETKPEKFVKAVANFGYARQEYFYRKVLSEHGIEVDAFVFVAVSTDQPHTVDCYSLSDEWLAMAGDDVEAALSDLARRTMENNWEPESRDKVVRLSPPNYLKYRSEYSL